MLKWNLKMRLLFLLYFLPCFVSAEINLPLQVQLIEMAKQDQAVRKQLGDAGWDKAPKELHAKLSSVDHQNTEKLKAILSKRQWLTHAEVGNEGVGAAFLIIQHSSDTEFQERMLPILKRAYLNNEGVSGQEVALLTDRVLIHRGQKQLYGTQADIKNGKVTFMPISEVDKVDERRAEMNMPPLEFYKKIMEEMYGIKDHPEIELN
ncbi:hypothetical protein L3V43_23365 [Pseudoalteromonas sp. L23]|uniref:DUF6624 domain-containing protein n=1 Tax=unclassified Pseudoalteromonas TaxID=194690 RepID=UPI001EF10E53|nr:MULTISPECIES: DUF6624 domain-containing protein [unclassified Pseudoalteromonas]MCF7516524.1 hypothetical protein [Pseudoalteromonas sp. L7]MCF7528576.1 hypothetical protein [Pseudoalteromonas sp. L23]MCX2766958.1 hypothetical protein [Pseudoalteromonas sp. B530]